MKRDSRAFAGVAANRSPIHVMHLLLKFGFGGSESGVLKLANGFDRELVRPTICSCLPADTLKERLRSDVPLFEMNRGRGNDLGFVYRLAKLLRRERPDVLHTHGWATLCEGVVAARLAGVPFVVHGEHGTLETRSRNIRAQRFVWNRVDRVLSVSSRLAERMASVIQFPAERIETLRNGVDLERFSPRLREEGRRRCGYKPSDLVIGIVGRLEPVKDQRTFVAALASLRARGVTFKAAIVGDGPLRPELESQTAGLGLSEHVAFYGKRVDVEFITAAMDIFVSSSVSEGLSNTILEAMATGLPVVATNVGGTDELVVDGVTGYMVPASKPDDMGRLLEKLGREPGTRAAMGFAGRRRAEREFDLALMIRRYERLYDSLGTPESDALHVVEMSRRL